MPGVSQVHMECRYTMTSMNIPEPVMSLAIMPKTREASGGFSKALSRFQKEDPTFKVVLKALLPVLKHAAAHSDLCLVRTCDFL